jgi:hypothetical protein
MEPIDDADVSTLLDVVYESTRQAAKDDLRGDSGLALDAIEKLVRNPGDLNAEEQRAAIMSWISTLLRANPNMATLVMTHHQVESEADIQSALFGSLMKLFRDKGQQ